MTGMKGSTRLFMSESQIFQDDCCWYYSYSSL